MNTESVGPIAAYKTIDVYVFELFERRKIPRSRCLCDRERIRKGELSRCLCDRERIRKAERSERKRQVFCFHIDLAAGQQKRLWIWSVPGSLSLEIAAQSGDHSG